MGVRTLYLDEQPNPHTAGRRQPMCRLAFCRHGMSPAPSASIEHVGMDDLRKPVVVRSSTGRPTTTGPCMARALLSVGAICSGLSIVSP
jgi:hypothetical protein